MAKEVTIKVDQAAGQLAVMDGALFLGETAPIKFSGCTLAEDEAIRLIIFDRDGTTALADNSTDPTLLDLRTELLKKAFHAQQCDHAFPAYAFTVNTAGERTGSIDARGILPIAWSPVIMTSDGRIGLYKGEKGDKGDTGGVDPEAFARHFSISDTYYKGELVYDYLNGDDQAPLVFYICNRTITTGNPLSDTSTWSKVNWLDDFYYPLVERDASISRAITAETTRAKEEEKKLHELYIDAATFYNKLIQEISYEEADRKDADNELASKIGSGESSIGAHISDTSNPHGVTYESVGTYSKEKIDELINELKSKAGTVKSVNGLLPDDEGAIILVANDVAALPASFSDSVPAPSNVSYYVPPIIAKNAEIGDLEIGQVNGVPCVIKSKSTIFFDKVTDDGVKTSTQLLADNTPVLTQGMASSVYASKSDVDTLTITIQSLNSSLEAVL